MPVNQLFAGIFVFQIISKKAKIPMFSSVIRVVQRFAKKDAGKYL